ncbi:hypothetical protein [Streptomyces cyaneofuscatus]|uniref:hypothetical protein n=1 Tax=Streptomyces cyaneofuscatus TaxID=66883 RepID=UPI0037A71E89
MALEDGYCHGAAFRAEHAGDDASVLTDREIRTRSSGGHGEATTTGRGRAAYLGNRAGETATGPGMLDASSDTGCTTDKRAYAYRLTGASRWILERRLTDGPEPVRFTLGG